MFYFFQNGLFRSRKPLLHAACERAAWRCTQFIVTERSEEIHVLKDEYYPIHYAVLHDNKFLELLINAGADTTVRTTTQQMTLLHVGESKYSLDCTRNLLLRIQHSTVHCFRSCSTFIFQEVLIFVYSKHSKFLRKTFFDINVIFIPVLLVAHKSAEDTLATIRLLLDHGCKELINAPDSLGNTPLHALIVRYALEDSQYGYDRWNKWDVLHLVRYLIQAGAKQSINHSGNSAIACVLRHVRHDWDVCYELLTMLLHEGGEYLRRKSFGSKTFLVTFAS